MATYHPQHMNADPADLTGNDDIGRYVFLTGSDQRAQQISTHFKDLTVKKHPRHHDLYLGKLNTEHGDIDVAAMSSGMGGPSTDIIVNELFFLGVKRILRIGTAGSLQPQYIRVGDIIIVTGAIRDDKASWDYIYKEYPAIASLEYVIAAHRAETHLHLTNHLYTGLVHTKSSLYAREMSLSLLPENDEYIKVLHQAGVLATEMECDQIFILNELLNARLHLADPHAPSAYAGALLTIVGDDTPFSDKDTVIADAVAAAIELGLETTRQLYYIDKKYTSLYG